MSFCIIQYRNLTFIIALLAVLTISCKDDKNRLMPSITGKAGEVLVVIDQTIWKNENTGGELRNVLISEHLALPQPEPMFDPLSIHPSGFGSVFKVHRNIILTRIGKGNEEKIILQNNVWAKPQSVITITAGSEKEFGEFVKKNSDKILNVFIAAEQSRIVNNYKRYEEKGIRKKIEANHNISVVFPKGFQIKTDTTNFMWIVRETPLMEQGVFIYYYDYVDTNTFTQSYLVDKRNLFLEKFVPGKYEDSYMTTTANEFYQPIYTSYVKNDVYTSELRGLWEMEGAFLGGPFLSLTKLDEKRNRVVTVEGFVYAPKYEKRNYVRELEGILNTFEFTE
jgi:hypothetical protein